MIARSYHFRVSDIVDPGSNWSVIHVVIQVLTRIIKIRSIRGSGHVSARRSNALLQLLVKGFAMLWLCA